MTIEDRTDPQASFVPLFGVWIIHKHRKTGALLGPCLYTDVPTYAVYAALEGCGWRELTRDEVAAYEEARRSTIH